MLQVLAPYARDININDKVMALYLDHLLPGITDPGTDNNYGSSAMYDVLALQVWLLTHLPFLSWLRALYRDSFTVTVLTAFRYAMGSPWSNWRQLSQSAHFVLLQMHPQVIDR